ncbi:peroxisomal catalase [Trichophaea hybrida]|nr:peroxisomal catalase [Trichophaea hybrida]
MASSLPHHLPRKYEPPPTDDPTEHYTLDNGCPILAPQASLRIGNNLQGPLLIQDINLLEIISHITHERIPERIVHAKGAGAHGVFEVTDDISDVTEAKFLSKIGKKTSLLARFSTVAGEKGSADSVRDSRGFAFKIYTEDGNLDWLFFSTPTFPIRDGGKFPSFVHCQKKDPQTGLRDATTFWDFMSRNPEVFNTIMLIFSDCGTPKSYRNSNIYGVNTYKFTKQDSFVFVKIHILTNQGVNNLTQQEAEQLAGEDPDAFTRDLHDSIASGNFPSWDVYAQIVKPEEVASYPVNIYDPTKRWPEDWTPLRKFGRITLNKNVENEFGEVEQASFNPTAIVPGWDVSADPILQTRLFAYGSASRYRLGINLHQIPVNAPLYSYNPTKRDGIGYINNLNPPVQPNYITADGEPKIVPQGNPPDDQDMWSGRVMDYESQVVTSDYDQPRELWNYFMNHPPMAEHFISNVALNLSHATKDVRERTYTCFANIDAALANDIRQATEMKVPAGDHLKFPLAGRNRGGVGG